MWALVESRTTSASPATFRNCLTQIRSEDIAHIQRVCTYGSLVAKWKCEVGCAQMSPKPSGVIVLVFGAFGMLGKVVIMFLIESHLKLVKVAGGG